MVFVEPVAQYSKESIEQVLHATDIVALVQGYVPLKRAGSQYRCNCPFHNEKTPSFYVNPSRQSFHCFGCGKGGDAISFVREYENLPFAEALQKLATRAGVPLQEDLSDPDAERKRRSRGRMLDLHREAAAFMHQLLLRDPAAAHARDYLKSRGYGKEMAVRWQLGWMPENPGTFLDWARERKFTGRELVDSGIAYQRDEGRPAAGMRVRFRDRLMFPICNEIGDIIAFSGRQIVPDARSGKYINSPGTSLYNKSRVVFALDRAKKAILKHKTAILCEGQIDAIACHEAGIDHAIAPLGTSLTVEHASLLRRYTSHVTICYDADSAGLAAAERAYRELIQEGLAASVVLLPPGDDPDTFLKTHGPDAFRTRVAEATDFFDFKLAKARDAGLLDGATTRAQVLNDCASILALMSDNAIRENQINSISTWLQTSPTVLRDSVSRLLRRAKSRPASAPRPSPDEPVPEPPAEPAPLHRIVGFLCHLALNSASAQHFLGEQYESIHEASRWLEGIPILESILANAPDPAHPAAINAFLSALPEPYRLALMRGGDTLDGAPSDGIQAAEHALAMLSASVLQRRDAAVKAELKTPGLSHDRMLELFEEAKEIQALMRGMGQRSEFQDHLPKATAKPPISTWKKKPRPNNP